MANVYDLPAQSPVLIKVPVKKLFEGFHSMQPIDVDYKQKITIYLNSINKILSPDYVVIIGD